MENFYFSYRDPEKQHRIKIVDYKMARNLQSWNNETKWVYTPGYIAPEVMTKKTCGLPADIFSCGIILYYLYFIIFIVQIIRSITFY